MRRQISISSRSLNAEGAARSRLSRWRITSATLRAGRSDVPLKITSSMPPPRIWRAELSPMHQRRPSRRLDLPQPLGPTMPVKPFWISNSVASTKDLNPASRSFVKWTTGLVLSSVALRQLLDQRLQHFLEFLDRAVAGDARVADDEMGRALDAVLLDALAPAVGHGAQHLLVLQARVELLLAHAGEAAIGGDVVEELLAGVGLGPLLLILHQEIDHGEVAVGAEAARHDRGDARPGFAR